MKASNAFPIFLTLTGCTAGLTVGASKNSNGTANPTIIEEQANETSKPRLPMPGVNPSTPATNPIVEKAGGQSPDCESKFTELPVQTLVGPTAITGLPAVDAELILEIHSKPDAATYSVLPGYVFEASSAGRYVFFGTYGCASKIKIEIEYVPSDHNRVFIAGTVPQIEMTTNTSARMSWSQPELRPALYYRVIGLTDWDNSAAKVAETAEVLFDGLEMGGIFEPSNRPNLDNLATDVFWVGANYKFLTVAAYLDNGSIQVLPPATITRHYLPASSQYNLGARVYQAPASYAEITRSGSTMLLRQNLFSLDLVSWNLETNRFAIVETPRSAVHETFTRVGPRQFLIHSTYGTAGTVPPIYFSLHPDLTSISDQLTLFGFRSELGLPRIAWADPVKIHTSPLLFKGGPEYIGYLAYFNGFNPAAGTENIRAYAFNPDDVANPEFKFELEDSATLTHHIYVRNSPFLPDTIVSAGKFSGPQFDYIRTENSSTLTKTSRDNTYSDFITFGKNSGSQEYVEVSAGPLLYKSNELSYLDKTSDTVLPITPTVAVGTGLSFYATDGKVFATSGCGSVQVIEPNQISLSAPVLTAGNYIRWLGDLPGKIIYLQEHWCGTGTNISYSIRAMDTATYSVTILGSYAYTLGKPHGFHGNGTRFYYKVADDFYVTDGTTAGTTTLTTNIPFTVSSTNTYVAADNEHIYLPLETTAGIAKVGLATGATTIFHPPAFADGSTNINAGNSDYLLYPVQDPTGQTTFAYRLSVNAPFTLFPLTSTFSAISQPLLIQGKFYFNALKSNKSEIYVFDPATGQAPLLYDFYGPTSSFASIAGFSGSKLLIVAKDGSTSFNLIRYDLSDNSWSKLNDENTVQFAGTFTPIFHEGIVFFQTNSKKSYRYDIASDTLTLIHSSPHFLTPSLHAEGGNAVCFTAVGQQSFCFDLTDSTKSIFILANNNLLAGVLPNGKYLSWDQGRRYFIEDGAGNANEIVNGITTLIGPSDILSQLPSGEWKLIALTDGQQTNWSLSETFRNYKVVSSLRHGNAFYLTLLGPRETVTIGFEGSFASGYTLIEFEDFSGYELTQLIGVNSNSYLFHMHDGTQPSIRVYPR